MLNENVEEVEMNRDRDKPQGCRLSLNKTRFCPTGLSHLPP